MFRSETGIGTRTRAGWADCSVDIITEMTEEAKKEKETLTEQRQSKPQTGLCWCTPRMFGCVIKVVNLLVFVHKENQTTVTVSGSHQISLAAITALVQMPEHACLSSMKLSCFASS